jgi:hypothetical protein
MMKMMMVMMMMTIMMAIKMTMMMVTIAAIRAINPSPQQLHVLQLEAASAHTAAAAAQQQLVLLSATSRDIKAAVQEAAISAKSTAVAEIAAAADEALQVAHSATPEALPQEIHQDHHGIALGQHAIIVAEAFGLEPTEGILVAASRTRYTLRREDSRARLVHVHFPRVGYLLKAKEAAS